MIVVAQSILPWWLYAGVIVVLALGIAYESARAHSEDDIPTYDLG